MMYNGGMPKLKSNELTGMPEESAIASKDIFNNRDCTGEDPRMWLLRYKGFSRITTDPQEVRVAVEDGARVIEYVALEDPDHACDSTMTPADRLRDCEDVLRSLASYLSVGGYNAPQVDPKVFHENILWGIQQIQHGEMI